MVENIYQIRMHSRGGQGAKTAGMIIAESYIEQGEFAQAFAEYGPERTGAPMKTFVRLSEKEIRLHGDVENPDMVIVMDDSLLEVLDVAEGIEKNGILLINTSKTKEVIASEINNKNCKIYTIDASGIAKELFGKNLPNTVIVGSIAKLIPSVSHKDVVRKLKEKFDAKLSEEVVRKNIEALERGYGAF
jgi:pyruvate ferredoxin oxidoreductase gamma subunit